MTTKAILRNLALNLIIWAVCAEPSIDYSEFEAGAEKLGYTWEPHQVYTQDGWRLTLLRITAVNDVSYDAEKPPVLMIHGSSQSAQDWILGFDVGFPALIAAQGYDVWVGSNRATTHSNYNLKDDGDQWSLEERWDFDWSDMGKYDVPAFVEKVREVTGQPKVTLMGYSQGGAQIFYALATNQDWYADKVHRFVALSACHFFAESSTYEIESARYRRFYELGLYNYWGKDESSVTVENCVKVSQEDCVGSYDASGVSIKSLMYFSQIGIAGQFQEPIELQDWLSGKIYSTSVNLSNIDRVPVSIVHAIQDQVCDTTMIEWTYAQMQQEEKYIRFEHGGHLLFGFRFNTPDDYAQRMVETIDYGTTLSQADSMLTASKLTTFFTLLLALSQF